MVDLIKARLVKYFSSPLLLFAGLVSLASGIYGGVYCTNFKNEAGNIINCPADDMWMLIGIWAAMILVSMCAGREFSDGTIRNKIAVGHTKADVFFAEIIVASVVTGIIYFLNITATAVGGWYFISAIPTHCAVKWFVNIFLTFQLMSILAVTVTFLLSKRAVAVVAAFALHFVLYIIVGFTGGYYYNIDEPRYGTQSSYVIYEDGTVEKTQQEFENGYYIQGLPKVLIQLEHAVNPMYGLEDALHFGHIRDRSLEEAHVLKQEQSRIGDLNADVLKMLAYCIAVSFAGAFLFRKKDLK